jgi:hypothetical protein
VQPHASRCAYRNNDNSRLFVGGIGIGRSWALRIGSVFLDADVGNVRFDHFNSVNVVLCSITSTVLCIDRKVVERNFCRRHELRGQWNQELTLAMFVDFGEATLSYPSPLIVKPFGARHPRGCRHRAGRRRRSAWGSRWPAALVAGSLRARRWGIARPRVSVHDRMQRARAQSRAY